jgi:ABC-type antimicrobial peptide transport system permease subunit
MDAINDKFLVDAKTIIITIIFSYLFNLFVGLLPVYKTIRKTPAQILSRTDIQ